MAPEVLEVGLAFPRGAEKSGPVGLVQDGDNPAATAYELVAGGVLNLEVLQWRREGTGGDVVEWGRGGGSCKHVYSEVRGQVLGDIAGVVDVLWQGVHRLTDTSGLESRLARSGGQGRSRNISLS